MKDRLEENEDLDDPIYISMIKDIYSDQLNFISKCRYPLADKLDDLNSKTRIFWLLFNKSIFEMIIPPIKSAI